MSSQPDYKTSPKVDEYRVSARKYRPTKFADLVGQDVLVRVLTNGLKAGKLPHAILLTGIRGIGKTTTARILARALNCTGRDVTAAPDPCGACDSCQTIGQDRNIDVIEMDAASRTGVEDIREIIENAKYKPVSSQYKVYIIDEVHMLSKSAFNALLKTLEEPPAHVKFIFATTEVQKVPKTVISRCMCFELRRWDLETLQKHLTWVCKQEKVQADEKAITLLARAADGSGRDGLSLLDQAIALSDGKVTAQSASDMLGLAEAGKLFTLLKAIIKGETQPVLDLVQELYSIGTDPLTLLNDLLEMIHGLTLLNVSAAANASSIPAIDHTEAQNLAQSLTMPTLNRLWQITLKGLHEAQSAPVPQQACQMVILRLVYASTLPSFESLIQNAPAKNVVSIPQQPTKPDMGKSETVKPQTVQSDNNAASNLPKTFVEVVDFIAKQREPLVLAHLKNNVHLVSYAPGKIEMRLNDKAPQSLPKRLGQLLKQWTNVHWDVIVSTQEGMPTLFEQNETKKEKIFAETAKDPLVAKALEAFPGAAIQSVEPTHAARG
ncbi:MAG: DNA polymerase III subunit gamma/tau [Pseudomonadota bacterium]